MKKLLCALFFLIEGLFVKAQLLINENFTGYSFGNLGSQGSWIQNGSGPDVMVNDNPALTYPGYAAGGNAISVAAINGIDPHKLFSTPVITSANSSFYISFLVQASNAASATLSEYSVVLRNSGNIGYLSRFFLIKNGTSLEFGISKSSAAATNITSGNYQFNTVYLVVIRYDVATGSSNDAMYLWVNPALVSEPDVATANLVITGGADASYGAAIDALMIHQRSSSSPNASFDGFRVANGPTHGDAWMNLGIQALLPVKLQEFKGSETAQGVHLSWSVSEELNFDKYEIEKSEDGISFFRIGTVSANKKRAYAFDHIPAEGISFYRIKMVDVDGSENYSPIIKIRFSGKTNIMVYPNPATNKIFIESHTQLPALLRMTDENGKLVNQWDIRSPLFSIDCSGLGKGIYYLNFSNGKIMMVKMIVKQ